MKRLKVTRYLQDPSHCAVGVCAAVANFYNRDIDYKYVKKIAYKKVNENISEEGLETSEICMLLNYLGFQKITLVTSDFTIVDYMWSEFSKKKMKETLKNSVANKEDKEDKNLTKNLYKWYNLKHYDNILKIDYNFGKYIRKHLNKRKPVVITFNWTMFQKYSKENEYGNNDPINGDFTEHAVVANGYDDNGVWVVDSHHQFYKYKRKKYRRGFYKISWENLMTIIGQGDVVLPDNYIE